MKIPIVVFIIMIISNVLIAQDPVQLETNLTITGQVTIGQDDTQIPARGMIRFDTITHTFQGYDGAVWIDLGASGADVNNQTDTLEIGDSHGGGIVFHTAGPNGLVVTEFDLADPNNILDEEIPWGDIAISTGATDQVNGQQNTMDIITALQNWSNGIYAAKICDDFDSGGYSDWYLPSVQEFMLMNQNVGTEAPTNIAQVGSTSYWTSTELSQINANYYRTSSSQGPGNFSKTSDVRIRAIRSY